MTPWTVAYQASLSMGFSRQEYWSGLPFPSPGDLPDPGIKPRSPTLQVDSLPSEPPGKPISGCRQHAFIKVLAGMAQHRQYNRSSMESDLFSVTVSTEGSLVVC